MNFSIGEWIEKVQAKPEHIRKRYVVLCVAVSMVLVIGVWIISVSESFKSVATESADVAEQGKNLLPKPSGSTLDQFLENKDSLGGDDQSSTGEQFFDEQYQNKENPQMQDEGVAPIDNNPQR